MDGQASASVGVLTWLQDPETSSVARNFGHAYDVRSATAAIANKTIATCPKLNACHDPRMRNTGRSSHFKSWGSRVTVARKRSTLSKSVRKRSKKTSACSCGSRCFQVRLKRASLVTETVVTSGYGCPRVQRQSPPSSHSCRHFWSLGCCLRLTGQDRNCNKMWTWEGRNWVATPSYTTSLCACCRSYMDMSFRAMTEPQEECCSKNAARCRRLARRPRCANSAC